MGNKHIAEVLTEVNNKITGILNKMDSEEVSDSTTASYIDNINGIIRSLDHVVEELEKKS